MQRIVLLAASMLAAVLTLQGCGEKGTTTTTTTTTTTSLISALCTPVLDTNCNNGENLNQSKVESAELCCALCEKFDGCGAWTFNNFDGADGKMCYLKKDCKIKSADSQRISGFKNSTFLDGEMIA
eukprot:TRINITY_DN1360_c0_g1_i1.p1 TRINITY_DN1360_c0_g1~~TRINITY_DN1360_c0_g1_i1.p1  ORF type:complete len:126 (-),score=29.80 TRINITY_DN1360_c0_g1_i1:115-492(-)